MTITKRKVTVSVDDDALTQVEESGRAAPSLSAYVNQLVLDDLAMDRQRKQILEIVADYEARFGEVSADRVEYYEELLA